MVTKVRGQPAAAASEAARPQPTNWRLLETDGELREALERALSFERASVARAQRRVDRVGALRSQLLSVVPAAGQQAVPRAS